MLASAHGLQLAGWGQSAGLFRGSFVGCQRTPAVCTLLPPRTKMVTALDWGVPSTTSMRSRVVPNTSSFTCEPRHDILWFLQIFRLSRPLKQAPELSSGSGRAHTVLTGVLQEDSL